MVSGNLITGKHRIPYIYSSKHREELFKNLTEEAKNEMWLTRSYLNPTEEKKLKTSFKKSFTSARPLLKHDKEDQALQNERYKLTMRADVKFEDKWNHVKDSQPWVEREQQNNWRVYWRESEACVPRSYPSCWPRPVDKWDVWNQIEGFGQNQSTQLTTTNDDEK